MNKQTLLKQYGHLYMNYIGYDGLHYFNTGGNDFVIAIEFLPNEYEPSIPTQLSSLEVISNNIVGSYIDGDLTVYDPVYELHLKERKQYDR